MSDALQPGGRLGHYEVVRPLSAGGMGVVYVARDLRLGREVALKVLPRTQANDESRQRFKREARAAAAVKHRSIAQVYDVDETDGQLWLAMELIEGETLAELLSRGPLPVPQSLALAHEIAAGLARAHAAQVIHRDLKPGNVMVDRDGQVKLLDFGLARLQDEEVPTEANRTATALTGKGRVMGTPGYMAPEQARGEVVDARADLFSLGVMLLEMLTGEQAFPGPNPMSRIVSTLRDEPVSIDRIGGTIAPDAGPLLKALLSKNPVDRPASAELVAQSLSQLRGVPVSAPSQPGTAKASPARRAWPLRVAGGVTVMVLLSAGAWLSRRPAPAAEPAASPQAVLRALFMDPTATVACLPFTVSGKVKAKEMGLVAGGTLCSHLAMWHWAMTPTQRFLGPAALLGLPSHGDETFPEDPFGSDDAQKALVAAAAKHAIVITGDIRVEDKATTLVVHVRSRDGAEFTVESTSDRIMAVTINATIALMDGLSVPPTVLPEEEAVALSVSDGRKALLLIHETTSPRLCQLDVKALPLVAAQVAFLCEHLGRTAKGNPDWPKGVDELLEAMPERRRAYFQLKFANPHSPEELVKKAEVMRAARKTLNLSSAMRSEYAQWEGVALLKANRPDEARTAFDVALKESPDNCEARQFSYQLSTQQEFELRAVTAWCPITAMWGWRAQAMADQKRAVPFYELQYHVTDRDPEWLLSFGKALFRTREYERVRDIASFHLERNARGDAGAAQYLLGLYDVANGNYSSALARHRQQALEGPTLSVLFNLGAADDLEELLGMPGTTCEAFLQKSVLAEPHRIQSVVYAEYLTDCLVSASLPTARKALPRLRQLLARGGLLRGMHTALVLDGYEKFLAGDAKGAVGLWRRHAADPAVVINAKIFAAAGEMELAEKRWRLQVSRTGPTRMGPPGLLLAKSLAKRGQWAEASELARQFIESYSRSDVVIPAVAEMKALLAKAPPAK